MVILAGSRYSDYVVLFSLAVAVLLLKYPILSLPYYWDEFHLIEGSLWMIENHLSFNLPDYLDFGHPPLLYELFAISYAVLGESLLLSRLLILVFSLLGLYYTYLLGSYVSDRVVGFLAAILLFFSPMYYSVSGEALFDIPLTALSVMVLYYGIRQRPIPYLLTAFSAVLIKEAGILPVLAVLSYVISTGISEASRIKKFLPLYSLPAFIWVAWLLHHQLIAGWIMKPSQVGFLPLSSAYSQFLLISGHFFLSDFRFILTFAIILILVLRRGEFRHFRYVPLLIMVLSTVFGFSLIRGFLIRYVLIAYPSYFLLGVLSLKSLLRRPEFYISFVFLLVLLSIGNWTGDRTDSCGCVLESNMEYADAVRTNLYAIKYLSKNYPNATVLSSWPLDHALMLPSVHYIEQPLTIAGDACVNGDLTNANIFVYSSQSACHGNLMKILTESAGNLTLIKGFEINNKITEIYLIN
ncbi:MAG: glycosyltransferase family 39 protein [Candidatus Altiarchaeota archaeon]